MKLNGVKCNNCKLKDQGNQVDNQESNDLDRNNSLNEVVIAKCVDCDSFLCSNCLLEHQLNNANMHHKLVNLMDQNMEGFESLDLMDQCKRDENGQLDLDGRKQEDESDRKDQMGATSGDFSSSLFSSADLTNQLLIKRKQHELQVQQMIAQQNQQQAQQQIQQPQHNALQIQMKYQQQQQQQMLQFQQLQQQYQYQQNLSKIKMQQTLQQQAQPVQPAAQLQNNHRLIQIENEIQKTYNFYLQILKERKDYLVKELNTIIQYALLNHSQNLNKQLQIQFQLEIKKQQIEKELSDLETGNSSSHGANNLKLMNNLNEINKLLVINNELINQFKNNNPLMSIEFLSNYSAIQTSIRNTFGYIRINQNQSSNAAAYPAVASSQAPFGMNYFNPQGLKAPNNLLSNQLINPCMTMDQKSQMPNQQQQQLLQLQLLQKLNPSLGNDLPLLGELKLSNSSQLIDSNHNFITSPISINKNNFLLQMQDNNNNNYEAANSASTFSCFNSNNLDAEADDASWPPHLTVKDNESQSNYQNLIDDEKTIDKLVQNSNDCILKDGLNLDDLRNEITENEDEDEASIGCFPNKDKITFSAGSNSSSKSSVSSGSSGSRSSYHSKSLLMMSSGSSNESALNPNRNSNTNHNPSHLIRSKMIYHCKFGEFGINNGQFTEPSGVTINSENDIIVADTNSHRIQIFDKDGNFKFKFGECGKRDGQLLYPNRVSIVKHTGDIVVTERSPTHQIQIYDKNGQFLRKFGANILQHPRGVCVDYKGRIIVVECKVMRVIIFDLYGNVLNKFNCSKYLEFPNGVCCSNPNNGTNSREEIYISDNRAHCIKVFDYNGNFIRQIGGEGVTNYPIGVGINSNNEILVADNHNNFNLTVFTQDGKLINALESKVKHAQCFDVGLMDDGSIVLASKDYRIYVYKYIASSVNDGSSCSSSPTLYNELPSIDKSENRSLIQSQTPSMFLSGNLSGLSGAKQQFAGLEMFCDSGNDSGKLFSDKLDENTQNMFSLFSNKIDLNDNSICSQSLINNSTNSDGKMCSQSFLFGSKSTANDSCLNLNENNNNNNNHDNLNLSSSSSSAMLNLSMSNSHSNLVNILNGIIS